MSSCEKDQEGKMIERGYQTPQKTSYIKNDRVQQTAADSYEKEGLSMGHEQQYHNAIHLSNTSANIFKRKRKLKKVFKQSTLKILMETKIKLEELKQKSQRLSQESVTQNFLDQMDKTYVICARINKIHEGNKLYTFYVQDDNFNAFRLYFWKSLNKQDHRYPSNSITSIQDLSFESQDVKGQPYFKFYVYFKQFNIVDKIDQQTVMNSQVLQSYKKYKSQKSNRNLSKPKLLKTELRIQINHFQKIQNFNYLTWHYMKTFVNQLEQKSSKAIQLDE